MNVIPNIANSKSTFLTNLFRWVPITEIGCNIVSSANMSGLSGKQTVHNNKTFLSEAKIRMEESLMFYDLKLSCCKKEKLQSVHGFLLKQVRLHLNVKLFH